MPETKTIRGERIDISLKPEDVVTITQPGRTPVKTGNLRDRFVIEDGEVRNDAFYAEWIERGTTRIRAHLMVEISIPEIADRFVRRVGQQLIDADLLDLPRSD